MIFKHDLVVTLDEKQHRYYDQHGAEYTSNSKLHKLITSEFDPDGQILKAVAKKAGISTAQQQALWDANNKKSTDKGTLYHNELDKYFKTGHCDPAFEMLANSIYNFYGSREFKAIYSEQVLFLADDKIAGTEDLVFQRKGKTPILDFRDYKTNKDGIVGFSKYNKFFKPPFDHLEHSVYNEYAMKMSMYGYMAETTWGYKVGSLGLIYIPLQDPMSWYEIPIPYMKKEAAILINLHRKNAAISI